MGLWTLVLSPRSIESHHARAAHDCYILGTVGGQVGVGITCRELTVGFRSEADPPFEPSQAGSTIGFDPQKLQHRKDLTQ
jgi:hypothetical protein